MDKIPALIIGGGVVGLAIAYEMAKTGQEVFLVEKNPRINSENQSSRNSGVIHAGINYQSESEPLKAGLCVEGNALMYEFCRKFGVPHAKTGKLVVATNRMEEEYLDYVLETAKDNGVPDIEMITGKRAKEMEPNVNATSALYFPTSGIIEPTRLVKTLETLAKEQKANIAIGNEVLGIRPGSDGFEVTIRTGKKVYTINTDILINSAGIYSDEITRMINFDI